MNRRQLAAPELKHAGRPHLKHPHWKPLSPFFDFVFDSELGSHGPHQKVCRWRVMVSQIRMSLFFPVDLPRSYRRLCMVHWCVAHCSLRPTACHAEITTFLEPARSRLWPPAASLTPVCSFSCLCLSWRGARNVMSTTIFTSCLRCSLHGLCVNRVETEHSMHVVQTAVQRRPCSVLAQALLLCACSLFSLPSLTLRCINRREGGTVCFPCCRLLLKH